MRKIIQISHAAATGDMSDWTQTIAALCDDGSVWHYDISLGHWERMEDIPQDDD